MATFGYCVEAATDWDELIEVAIELDRNSRFDSFWLGDSLVANGPPDWPRLDAWTALAAVAHATSRLRLGVLVSGNAYRHPALLAKIATTIDRISGGRVELGIGAGWPAEKNRRYGIDFWSRRERLERLDEAIQVIKLLWIEERPSFRGRYYNLDEPPYSPRNVQQPYPPIVVGGGSDPMLRAIARHADKASPMIDAAEAKAKVTGFCQEIGRDPSEIHWQGGGMLFLNDDEAVQRRAAEIGSELYGEGTPDEVMAGDLFGSLEKVTLGVRRQIEAGMDEIVVFQLPRIHLKSLMRFSDEVIPRASP